MNERLTGDLLGELERVDGEADALNKGFAGAVYTEIARRIKTHDELVKALGDADVALARIAQAAFCALPAGDPVPQRITDAEYASDRARAALVKVRSRPPHDHCRNQSVVAGVSGSSASAPRTSREGSPMATRT